MPSAITDPLVTTLLMTAPRYLAACLLLLQAPMPSLFQGVSEHVTLFKRLNLAANEYEALAEDLRSFISSSVLDKMDSIRGGGGTESGGTLGELRRVRPYVTTIDYFVWDICFIRIH